MNYKRFISSAAIVLIIFINVISGPGCANIVPPQGGPRDSLPPVLEKADPGDSSKNFKGNRITFTFDEFIDVQSIQENLMVSPQPNETPIVDYKLKTVTVKLKDTLEQNTTYTLNFRDAVRDVNEGNIYKNFTYTFSTGPYLDSLQLAGKVILAETGRADSTLIVVLHTSNDDSAVQKEKPRYITRLDSRGYFLFTNLPAKTFYVYALKDESGTKRYMNPRQLFAFADKPVAVSAKTDSITLYAYAAKKDKLITAATPTTGGKPTTNAADRRLRYTNNLDNKQQDLLGNFIFTFEQAIKTFDSSKLTLFTDSLFTPVTDYSFQKDSTNRKIVLKTVWKENTPYHIILDKDFAEDSTGKKLLRTDTLSFTTKKKTDYGILKLRIRNLDLSKNPILQILINGNIVRSVPMSGNEFTDNMFPPGEYELQVLFDENKNGQWDPGDFFGKHKQPELVKPIQRKIVVKPVWQNEFEIAL
jgi:Bacterial Ig-like domain